MRRLALEGLVVVYPRRGTFASSIDITSLSDITDVRCQLEPHAAARAATLADAADRHEAAALMSELDAPRPSQRSLIELDARVHRFVHRCSRNPYLARDLDRYLNMSLRIWHLTFDRLPPLDDPVREHRALLEAIGRGDAEAARAIALEHVLGFAREMRAALVGLAPPEPYPKRHTTVDEASVTARWPAASRRTPARRSRRRARPRSAPPGRRWRGRTRRPFARRRDPGSLHARGRLRDGRDDLGDVGRPAHERHLHQRARACRRR